MNKKTFQNRPVPNHLKPEEITSFIQSGPGLDQKPVNPDSQKPGKPTIRIDANTFSQSNGKPETQKTDNPAFVNFTVKIPIELHRQYKASCSLRGVKMVDEISAYIKAKLGAIPIKVADIYEQ